MRKKSVGKLFFFISLGLALTGGLFKVFKIDGLFEIIWALMIVLLILQILAISRRKSKLWP
jgi:hypothetical protein